MSACVRAVPYTECAAGTDDTAASRLVPAALISVVCPLVLSCLPTLPWSKVNSGINLFAVFLF